MGRGRSVQYSSMCRVTDWSDCSGVCDQDLGMKFRLRVADGDVDGRSCNRDIRCPTWGGWGQWSACANGEHTRTRNCADFDDTGVTTKNKYCSGDDSQTASCDQDTCTGN